MPVSISRLHGAVVLRLSNGAVNALSIGNGFVAELRSAFEEAVSDPTSEAIIIAGEGRMFCGGADISDFDGDHAQFAQLRDTLLLIENSPKPVIIAIHGMALGGGLELALAGHVRVAQKGAKFALPEISLGLLPGAGGTQRLPRLIGARAALGMMLSGKPMSADEALALGLIDEVIEGDPIEAALSLATRTISARNTGALPVPEDLPDAVHMARAEPDDGRRGGAVAAVIDCVAALPEGLEAGLALEARVFEQLILSEASRGLRHAFFGERQVARIPGLPKDVSPRSIASVGIVGGGLMGTGIALALLNAGMTVTMVEARPEALEKAQANIRKTIQRDVDKRRIDTATADRRVAAFSQAPDIDALSDVDLVIEAVFEDMSAKKAVFSALDAVVRPDTILASNTSTLDLDEIASFVRDPSRVVGLHFFSPANVMRLLEVVRGEKTAPDVLATALSFSKAIGKIGVVSGVCDGFIGNRIFEEYLRQVYFLLEEGALPQQIDAALERWGMAMGPCRTMDLVGQDIGWAIRKRRTAQFPDQPYSGVIDRICEIGRFGQKTGAGFYLYRDGRTAEVDPAIDKLVVDYSAEIGLTRREIGDGEILSRCLLAMINEGARILGEGIAYRPVDIDVVYLHGYGFPRDRGGPMFQADIQSLPLVLDQVSAFGQARNGWAFTPAPLLETLAGERGSFEQLNG
ncbi:3-hydroxyacyl-CoA dehydrogenase [Sphingomonas gei]|uniref:3-hydroxyacyl-CoA dehydrogenase n=1 Tax=Sphingomonas gei TaxID=1395960 RepID=A0A4S1WZR6_9SPHN|nr:3-hydroxyacyl-CoA dehydrogenase NAD-binding domain-containing protein [Sphingomonas gei]TGX49099.1 3-hydroxyacyl-CoA dehydrogenase [Sphingomonas gei]